MHRAVIGLWTERSSPSIPRRALRSSLQRDCASARQAPVSTVAIASRSSLAAGDGASPRRSPFAPTQRTSPTKPSMSAARPTHGSGSQWWSRRRSVRPSRASPKPPGPRSDTRPPSGTRKNAGSPTRKSPRSPFPAFTSKKKAFHTTVRLVVRRVRRLNPKSVPEGQAELLDVWRHHASSPASPPSLPRTNPCTANTCSDRAALRQSGGRHARPPALEEVHREHRLAHSRSHRIQPHSCRRIPRLQLPRQSTNRHKDVLAF